MMKNERKALTAKEVSEIYGINLGTLANLRWSKLGPKYYRAGAGRRIVYKPEDVEKWLFASPILTIDSLDGQR
jgi:hypothetical protein